MRICQEIPTTVFKKNSTRCCPTKRGEHTSQLVMELLTSSTRDAKWRLLKHLELLVLALATSDVA